VEITVCDLIRKETLFPLRISHFRDGSPFLPTALESDKISIRETRPSFHQQVKKIAKKRKIILRVIAVKVSH